MFFFLVFFFLSFWLLAFQSLIRLLLISVKTGPFHVSSTKLLHRIESNFTACIFHDLRHPFQGNVQIHSLLPTSPLACVYRGKNTGLGAEKSWILSVDMQCMVIPLGIHLPSLRLSFSHLCESMTMMTLLLWSHWPTKWEVRAFSYSASAYSVPSHMRHLDYRNKGKALQHHHQHTALL